jgi:lysozyme
MSFDPKKTVDVSTMALVDKEGLIDDLAKRLKQEIKNSVVDSITAAHEEIADILKDAQSQTGGNSNAGSSTGTGKRASFSSQGRTRSSSSNKDFEQSLKDEDAAGKVIKKLDVEVNKQIKENQKKSIGKHLTSRKIGENLNQVAGRFQSESSDELENTIKELDETLEGIKIADLGEKGKKLTESTINLQKAVIDESRKRKTILGKMGGLLEEEGINAASIITGILGDSPMMGLLTKATLEVFKHFKEKAKKKRAEKLKFGNVQEQIPRPETPNEAPQNPKHDIKSVHDALLKQPPGVRQKSLDDLLQKGQITQDEYDNESKFLFSPEQYNAPPPITKAEEHNYDFKQNLPPDVTSPTPVEPEEAPWNYDRPPREFDDIANELSQQSKGQGRAWDKKQADERFDDSQKANLRKKKEELEEAKKNLESVSKQPDADVEAGEGLFNSPVANAKLVIKQLEERVADLEKLIKDAAEKKNTQEETARAAARYAEGGTPERVTQESVPGIGDLFASEQVSSNVRMMPTFDEQKKNREAEFGQARTHVIPQMAARPELVRAEESEEVIPHLQPELVKEEKPDEGNGLDNVVSILKGEKKTEEDESKKLDVFSWRNRKNRLNPFFILEKHSSDMLVELKAIKALLTKQLEETDEAADAAERATKEKGAEGAGESGGLGGIAGLLKKMQGGTLKGMLMDMFIEQLGTQGLLAGGKLAVKKVAKMFGKKAIEKVAETAAEDVAEDVAVDAAAAATEAAVPVAVDAAATAAATAGATAAGTAGAATAGTVAAGTAATAAGTAGAATAAGTAATAAGTAGAAAGGLGIGAAAIPVAVGVALAGGIAATARATGADKAMAGGNNNVVPGVTIDDWTHFLVDALKDNGVDVSRRWYDVSYAKWSNSVLDARDAMNKKTGSKQWFQDWLIKNHPDAAKKIWGDVVKKQETTSPTPATAGAMTGGETTGGVAGTAPEKVGGGAPVSGLAPGAAGAGGTSDISGMHVSDAGLEELKSSEGLKKEISPDAQGKSSIGYGHDLLPGEEEKYKSGISEAEATELLKKDVAERYESLVKKGVKVPLKQDQFDALTSMAYNVGHVPQSVLTKINAGDMAGAATAIQKFGNKVNPELISRRQKESTLFAGNAPSAATGVLLAENVSPTADQGVRLTKASTEQKDLQRSAENTPVGNINTVIAPSTVANNTTVQDTKALNSEPTYQRVMNAQYATV